MCSMTLADLLHDPSFKNWAEGKPGSDSLKWDNYLDLHPSEAELLLTARDMVKHHPFSTPPVDDDHISQAWLQTQTRIRTIRSNARRRFIRATAAAAIAFILVAISAVWIVRDSGNIEMLTCITGPGEIRTILLEDGSVVTLNGNSELHYPEKFTGEARQVVVRGEAYFDVTHLQAETPFIVKTEEFNVKVLGTTFNVKDRPSQNSVSLVEGRVELQSDKYEKPVMLKPGQTAHCNTNTISINYDDVLARSSWRQHLWTFNETPLSEILTALQETFNVRASIGKGVNAQRTVSGKLSIKDLETLYKALEAMFDIEIIQKQNEIVIQKIH